MNDQTSQLSDLLKLSGMSHHGGKTAEHWIALVGVDPRTVSGIDVHRGLCYWTTRAEKICRSYWNSVQSDLRMLTSL